MALYGDDDDDGGDGYGGGGGGGDADALSKHYAHCQDSFAQQHCSTALLALLCFALPWFAPLTTTAYCGFRV